MLQLYTVSVPTDITTFLHISKVVIIFVKQNPLTWMTSWQPRYHSMFFLFSLLKNVSHIYSPIAAFKSTSNTSSICISSHLGPTWAGKANRVFAQIPQVWKLCNSTNLQYAIICMEFSIKIYSVYNHYPPKFSSLTDIQQEQAVHHRKSNPTKGC